MIVVHGCHHVGEYPINGFDLLTVFKWTHVGGKIFILETTVTNGIHGDDRHMRACGRRERRADASIGYRLQPT